MNIKKWHVEDVGLIIDEEGNGIASVRLIGNEEVNENAMLIVAAPELLAACESVLEMINRRFGEYNETINESRDLLQSAIAKAKGC